MSGRLGSGAKHLFFSRKKLVTALPSYEAPLIRVWIMDSDSDSDFDNDPFLKFSVS